MVLFGEKLMESQEARKLYGESKTPIKATRAFVKPLAHFKDSGTDGKAWILIDDATKTRTSVNTYNGGAGRNFKPKQLPLPEDPKVLAKLLKGYSEVPVSECPVATV